MSKMKTSVPGLFPAYLEDGSDQKNQEYTFGGLADSFYEYLLKMWLFTGKSNNLYQKLYDEAITVRVLLISIDALYIIIS